MQELPDRIILKASPFKWSLMLLAGLVFVAGGVFLLINGDDPLIAWLCIGFFGLIIPISLVQLIRPGTLEMDREGFTQTILGRKMDCRWDAVSEFGWYSMRGGKFVTFSRLEDENHMLAGVARTMVGNTGQLGDTFGMKASELAQLLNAFRARAIGE